MNYRRSKTGIKEKRRTAKNGRFLEITGATGNNLDNVNVPIIVRLQGTNSDKAKEIIDNSGLNVLSASAFDEAATKVQAAIN